MRNICIDIIGATAAFMLFLSFYFYGFKTLNFSESAVTKELAIQLAKDESRKQNIDITGYQMVIEENSINWLVFFYIKESAQLQSNGFGVFISKQGGETLLVL